MNEPLGEIEPVGWRQAPSRFSDKRIQETILVWSKANGRPISRDEAIEIMTNVRRLHEVLIRAEAEKAGCDVGAYAMMLEAALNRADG